MLWMGGMVSVAMAAQPGVVIPDAGRDAHPVMAREYNPGAGKALKAQRASSTDFDPYYKAPDGVLFLGLSPKANLSGAYYALAPEGVPLTFKSSFSDGDYTWDYTDGSGSGELTNEDLVVTYPEVKPYDAPSLYCIGYGGRGSYTMAGDGVAAGYGFLPDASGNEYFGTNVNTAELRGLFYDPYNLSVNFPDANTNIAGYYAGTGVSDIALKGFAEEFSYVSPYRLEAIRADVVYADGTAGATGHLVADVYPFDPSAGVDFEHKIATYKASSVAKHDDYFYGFDFVTDDAPVITTPIMVVVHTLEGCSSIISPAQLGLTTLHADDHGTSYLYASYKMGTEEVADGCLPYSGVEMKGSNGNTFYHNHWNVSIKRTYVTEALEPAPLAHAYQMGDASMKFGFVSFPVNDLTALTLDKSVSSYSAQIGAGEWVDGLYYGYTLNADYDYGDGLETESFVVYDTADNFAQKTKINMSGEPRVVDMAFDYTSNTMYAMVELKKSSSGKIGKTALHVVDMTNGKLTLVGLPGDITAVNGNGKPVEEHLMTLAAGLDGQLYAMGEYRQLYKVDRLTGAATAVGERQRIAVDYDFQTMAFDGKGNLYFAQKHPDYEYFMQIDPADGSLLNPVTGEKVTVNSDFSNNAARFPSDPQITGLYFADRAVDAASPKAVSALSATLREGTPNTVDLAWTLPAEAYDGTATSVTSVKVFRFGTSEAIATLAGDATSYTDEAAPNGDVTYCVVASNGEHAGFPALAGVFAGADKLKAVTSLNAVMEGSTVTLTWEAPTATVNGGYADYDNITYIVSRLSGSAATLLSDDVKTTTFTTELTENGAYTFEVVPVTCGVSGVAAVSNEVKVVSVAGIPYESGFEDDGDGTLWTISNSATGSNGWSIVKGYAYQQLDGKFAQFKTGGSATIPADDWLISPAIHMASGVYVLSYYANGGSFDKHTYTVNLGTDAGDTASFSQELIAFSDEKVYDEDTAMKNYRREETEFRVAAEGDYHLGFHGIGCATYATLKIDNVSIVAKGSGIDGNAVSESGILFDAGGRSASCAGATAMQAVSVQGMEVASSASSVLDLSAVPAGVYIVKATTAAGCHILKVVIR